jgi:hypothetical protein
LGEEGTREDSEKVNNKNTKKTKVFEYQIVKIYLKPFKTSEFRNA